MPIPPENDFLQLAGERAGARPDGLAFVDYDVHAARAVADGTSHLPSVRVTYSQFFDRAIRLAGALRERGVDLGDVVAVQLPNRHEFALFHLALYAIGAVTMPVSPIYRSRDLRRMLEISSAVGVVVPSSFGSTDYLAMVDELAPELPALRLRIEAGPPSSRAGFENLEQLLASPGGPDYGDKIASGALVAPSGSPIMLNFTSGTSGEPKGVLHSRETLCAGVLATTTRLELSGEDTIFVPATLGHAGGFLNGIFMPLLLGARVAFMNLWDPALALRIMETETVTYGAMMPTYLVDLTRDPGFAATDLSSWRTARVSGGVIPRGVMDALHQRLPDLRLCPGWGMSESLYVTCAGPGDPVDRRNGTDGRVVGTCEIEIRDTEDEAKTLPFGAPGHIVIKAPSLMLSYFDRPELTEQMWTADRWFKTGDLGVLDADGWLTIRGRLKDIVLRGGENVPIVEVETMLMAHDKVVAVSVVGVPDDRLGERVCAVVVCEPSLPPLEMDEMCSYLASKGLTRQFIPEYLVVRPELPLTAHGKVRKTDVKKIAVAALGLDDPLDDNSPNDEGTPPQ